MFISFTDPASKHKMKAASTVDRMPVVFDQFMIDAQAKRPGGLKTKKQLKKVLLFYVFWLRHTRCSAGLSPYPRPPFVRGSE